jgi:DNA-binding response OmpR family regulator
MTPSILVVEHDEQVRGTLRGELERCGYDVCEAADGNEAMIALRTAPFDLVISDITVPEKDGIEIMGYVRKEHPGTPVVIIGESEEQLYLESARGLGAACTLCKPVSPDELTSAVKQLLAEHRIERSP